MDLRFPREGISYDELSGRGKRAKWESLDWGDEAGDPDELVPDKVKRLGDQPAGSSTSTPSTRRSSIVMERGHKVAGRRPAREDDHFRQEPRSTRCSSRSVSTTTTRTTKATSPASIDNYAKYPQSLIDAFSLKEKEPHIADLGGHARHRDRRAGGGEPRLLQAGLLEDQILADDRARDAPVPGPVRTG